MEFRKILSHLYIKGSGIEIDPLNQTLSIKKGTVVKYVDKCNRVLLISLKSYYSFLFRILINLLRSKLFQRPIMGQ